MRLAIKPCALLFKIKEVLNKVDLLIVGDFPPATHTGISLVNALVRDILIENGRIVHVIDESAWNYRGFARLLRYLLGSHLKLFLYLLKAKPRYVYLNVPLSFVGELRLLFTCLIVKVFSRKSKLVGHIHRGDLNSWINRNFFNRYVFRVNLNLFSTMVLLSKKFENDLLKMFPWAHTTVIPNTSLLEGIQRENNQTFTSNFICISNIIRTKGLGDLVEAFQDKRLKDSYLTIAGNVYDKVFFKSISRYANRNISFIVNPDRDRVTDLLGNADCLILPSWNEGQPLVILEAMSLGIPIIATDVGDIPDMVGNDYPFICQPHNPSKLVEKILMFINYYEKEKLGEQLKNTYYSKYSRKLFTDKIIELFP